MAKGKKSFLFYCDWKETFAALPKDKGYDLLMHLLEYVNDESPETEDPLLKALFPMFKNTLKRDLDKYESIVDRNRKNGQKGGRPSKPKKPSGFFGNPKEPKKADIDIDSDTVIEIDKEKKNIEYRRADFKKSLSPFLDNYGKNLLNEFYAYWTEKNPRGVKLRFEKEKTFEVSKRLATWKANGEKWSKEKTGVVQPEKSESVMRKLENL